MLIHFDTEYGIKPHVPDSRIAALAYSRQLGHLGRCLIVDLPDCYLKDGFDAKERAIRRADLNSALTDGLIGAEWDACVARAEDFWGAADQPKVKIRALVLAFGETVFNHPQDIEQLLKDQTPTAQAAALKAFCRKIRAFAYDEDAKAYDETKLTALVQPTLRLFSKIMGRLPVEHVRQLIGGRPDESAAIQLAPPSLLDRGIVIRGDAAYRKSRSGPYKLIANVVPSRIVTGEARYLNGPAFQRHVVTLRGREEPIEVFTSLWAPPNWTKNPDNEITIPSPTDFKSLLHHAIAAEGIRSFDESASKTLWAGTYMDGAGNLCWQDGVVFPFGDEECPYSGRVFPDGADLDALKLLADLYSDGSVAVWLAWDLGSVFKPVFRGTYPHCPIVGESGTGKSTIADRISDRLGRRRYTTEFQWSSDYRLKRTLANTNVPVILDEVQRLAKEHRPAALEALNSAYNVQFATHGKDGQTYVIGTPATMLGQDFPFEDIALEAKIVRITLDEACRDRKALERLDRTTALGPYRAWLRFACAYANSVNIQAEVDADVEWLRSDLADCNYAETSNTARMFQNYAFPLFTARVLEHSGVRMDIRDRVASLLREHLVMRSSSLTGRDRESIGKQFVQDVVLAIQTPRTRSAFPWLVRKGDLYVSVSKAMEHLARGTRYDGITADGMARQLKLVGADFEDSNGKHHRPTINGVQTRCVRIPVSLLGALDCSVAGLDTSADPETGADS